MLAEAVEDHREGMPEWDTGGGIHWPRVIPSPPLVEPDDPPTVLECEERREGLHGEAGSVRRYVREVLEAATRLEVRVQGGTGDADLYLRHETPPDLEQFDFRPYVQGNDETVIINDPAPGQWHVMIHGSAPYEGATLSTLCCEAEVQRERVEDRLPQDLELAMYYEFSEAAVEESHSPERRNRALRAEGRAAFNRGDYERAAELWSRWSRLDPDNPEPVSLVGDIFLRQEKLEQAIEQYKRSLDIRPGQMGLVRRLARLLDVEAEDPVAARSLLNRYGRLFPGQPTVTLAKAEWLLRRRRYDEAERLIRQVMETHPDNLGALTLLHGLLETPQARVENIDRILEMGRLPSRTQVIANAIGEHQLMTRPEAWRLMGFVEHMAYHAEREEVRHAFMSVLPRQTVSVEDFRIGRLSRNWISSREFIWSEEGDFLLSADASHTEAYLRLVGSDALHNGFVEATIMNTRGHFWIYARRGEGNMIRFGFDEDGRLYQQIWQEGQLRVNESRMWTQPAGTVRLKLEVRGDGVFTFIDGRPAFGAPLSLPRDMGLGWWGVAPWFPVPGEAAVTIRRIAGGPQPVRIGLLRYGDEVSLPREEGALTRLRSGIEGTSAVAPTWYRAGRAGRLEALPVAADEEVRLFSRFYGARLMPVARLPDPLTVDWEHLAEIARRDRLDGFTLPVAKMPDPDWIADAEINALEADVAVNLLLIEPGGRRAMLHEIVPYVGLFPGARRARQLPVVDAHTPEAPDPMEDTILQL